MARSIDQETLSGKQSARLKGQRKNSGETFREDESAQMTAEQSDDVDESNTSRHHLDRHRHLPLHHLADVAKPAGSPNHTSSPTPNPTRSPTTTLVRTSTLSQPNQHRSPSLHGLTTPPSTAASAPKSTIDRPVRLSRHTQTGYLDHISSSPAAPITTETPPGRQVHTSHHILIGSPTTTKSAAAMMPASTERLALAGLGLQRPRTVSGSAAKTLEPFVLASNQSGAVQCNTNANTVLSQKRPRSDADNDEHERELDHDSVFHKRMRKEIRVEVQFDRFGMPRLHRALMQDGTSATGDTNTASRTPARSNIVTFRPRANSGAAIAIPTQSGASATGTPDSALRPAWQPDRNNFSLLGAIIEDSSLIIELVSYLDIPSLISWYAIDKKFHWYYNKNVTAFILASVRTWAPGAEKIYPWRCYDYLCIKDPIKRQKQKFEHLGPDILKLNLFSRDCPSMRWLQMVVWREGVVTDMVIQLMIKGLRVPRGTIDAVKRMWFIMDLPINAYRLACVRNKTLVPDKVLELATHFFLKVDMFLTNPAPDLYPINHPNQSMYPNRWANGMAVGCNLREILLEEKSLTPLWRVIRGWAPDGAGNGRPIESVDVLKLWMRHRFRFDQNTPPNLDRTLPILGLRMEDFQNVGMEKQVKLSTGRLSKPQRILAPDLLVMGEALRRRIDMSRKWYDMMSYGFLDHIGKKVPVPTEAQILKSRRSYWTIKEKRIIAANQAEEKKRLEASAAERMAGGMGGESQEAGNVAGTDSAGYGVETKPS